jgi:hypothetical protein
MKSLKLLLATLILGSSSLALAKPIVRDHREQRPLPSYYEDNAVVRDHRLEQDSRLNHFRIRRVAPITLASNLELDLRNPAYLQLGNGIKRLRFDADEGRAFIHSVVLVYSNGAMQTIDVRNRVTSRSAPLTIDIDARATGVYVYAKTRGRGSLDVVGLRR